MTETLFCFIVCCRRRRLHRCLSSQPLLIIPYNEPCKSKRKWRKDRPLQQRHEMRWHWECLCVWGFLASCQTNSNAFQVPLFKLLKSHFAIADVIFMLNYTKNENYSSQYEMGVSYDINKYFTFSTTTIRFEKIKKITIFIWIAPLCTAQAHWNQNVINCNCWIIKYRSTG